MDAVQGTFTVGLSKIADKDVERVTDAINQTLHDSLRKGFTDDRVESILHQFEIDQKQRSGTFGMNLLFRMVSLISHRVQPTPTQALQIDSLISQLR